MNKLLIVSALLLATNIASAEGYRLVSTDNSALSALCITAVETPDAVSKSARAIGLNAREFAELRCNGQTLPVFLSKFRDTESSPAVTYVFAKTNATEETELCYAAVKSEQQYEQVKDTYFDDEQRIEEEVLCNGMPLKTFARKYRNRALTASTK
jgi:hypothetical protein